MAAVGSSPTIATAGSAAVSGGRLPLRFGPNGVQSDPRVLFLARGSGYGLYLTAEGSVMVLRRGGATEPAVLRWRLVGARPEPEAVGVGELPGRSHYFLGRDPTRWRTDVPQYARVELREVYPGIHLTYYGKEGQLEYDFVVAPRATLGASSFASRAPGTCGSRRPATSSSPLEVVRSSIARRSSIKTSTASEDG